MLLLIIGIFIILSLPMFITYTLKEKKSRFMVPILYLICLLYYIMKYIRFIPNNIFGNIGNIKNEFLILYFAFETIITFIYALIIKEDNEDNNRKEINKK